MTDSSIVDSVLETASKKFDGGAEVYYAKGSTNPITIDNNELKSIETKQSSALGLRVINNGRIGFSAISDFSAVSELIDAAERSARFGQEAKFSFPEQQADKEVNTFNPEILDYSTEDRIKIGLNAVETLRKAHSDVYVSVEFETAWGEHRIANTSGLNKFAKGASCSVGVDALRVGDDGGLLNPWDTFHSRNIITNVDALTANISKQLTLAKNEVAIGSERLPVIFKPCTMGVLIQTFLMGCSGKTAQKGISPLLGKIDEQLLDTNFTLTDNPLLEGGLASCAHDGEGLPRKARDLFAQGRFTGFLYDLQTAGLDNATSTASAKRGAGSQPAPGITNIIVANGGVSNIDMYNCPRAIVVHQLLGAGQSNMLSGDVSANLELAFLVENGEIVGRVKNAMIAGNTYEMFKNIDAIGSEAENHGAITTPAFRFSDMSVEGNA